MSNDQTPDPRTRYEIERAIGVLRHKANNANLLQNDNIDYKLNIDLRNFHNRMAEYGERLLATLPPSSEQLIPLNGDFAINWWVNEQLYPEDINRSLMGWRWLRNHFVLIELVADTDDVPFRVVAQGSSGLAVWSGEHKTYAIPVPATIDLTDKYRFALYLISETPLQFVQRLREEFARPENNITMDAAAALGRRVVEPIAVSTAPGEAHNPSNTTIQDPTNDQ